MYKRQLLHEPLLEKHQATSYGGSFPMVGFRVQRLPEVSVIDKSESTRAASAELSSYTRDSVRYTIAALREWQLTVSQATVPIAHAITALSSCESVLEGTKDLRPGRCIKTHTPVSYTHLDVYKRQEQYTGF